MTGRRRELLQLWCFAVFSQPGVNKRARSMTGAAKALVTKCMTVITADVVSHMTHRGRRGKEGFWRSFKMETCRNIVETTTTGAASVHLCHTPLTFEQHHNLHPQSTHTGRARLFRRAHALPLSPGRPVGQEMLLYQIPVSCSRVCRDAFVQRPAPACTLCLQDLPQGPSLKRHFF